MKEKKEKKITKTAEELEKINSNPPYIVAEEDKNGVPTKIIQAHEIIIEQEQGETIIKAETAKQKAVRLLSALTKIAIEEYAAKYDIKPATTEAIAEFLVSKKPGSLAQNKIW